MGEAQVLTAGDDYPLHQRPEPIALSGTDRNFYDRYFFNGQDPDGSLFFAAALGVYPHLDILDGAFSVLVDGVQRSVLVSRPLNHERMDTEAGPLAIAVLEPLKRLAVRLGETGGLAADLVCSGLHHPVEEPRFTRRIGSRTLMDATRMTQNVAWEGTLAIDGRTHQVAGFAGTRDRSWGVRPVGAPDPQPPAVPPQFFWLWAPMQFGRFALFAHTNDDAGGEPWNRSAVLVDCETGAQERLRHPVFHVRHTPGTRRAATAGLAAERMDGTPVAVEIRPQAHFQMAGLGYGHPTRGHGLSHGGLSVAHESWRTADVDPARPMNAHVQALVSARLRLGEDPPLAGRGVLEQLVIGPHAPSGFQDLFDLA
jgi:hypothetical protein